MNMIIEQIDIDAIEVSKGRRVVDPNWVEALADDIKTRGQQTPIEVVKTKTGFRLISGAHRLNAIKHTFGQTIFAIVKDPADFASEAEMRLSEIAENFMRRELSALDRAMDVAAWREIYEAAKGAVKPGRKAKSGISVNLDTNSSDTEIETVSGKFANNFTEAAQEALRLSQKGIFRALKISTIDATVRKTIALFPLADNQSELLALAAQSLDRQGPIAQLIIAGAAKNVAEAIAVIDKLPEPKHAAAWEKLSSSFAKLKEREQNRFFELNRAAIERWMAS